jgi:hypothetical protein
MALGVQNLTGIIFKSQFVPRSKHSVSAIETNHLMLYREINQFVMRSVQNTQTQCRQNVEFFYHKLGDTQYVLKD